MTFVWLLTALPGSWGAAHGVLAVPHRLRRLWDCGYRELAKSYLSKAETQQKNGTGGEKAKASASTILFCQLSIQAGWHLMTKHVCGWAAQRRPQPRRRKRKQLPLAPAGLSGAQAPRHSDAQDSHWFELVCFLRFCLDNRPVGNCKGLSQIKWRSDKHTPK